jgi:hypothetical protein
VETEAISQRVLIDISNRLQSLVPSALQLTGDEPIGWINSIVLSSAAPKRGHGRRRFRPYRHLLNAQDGTLYQDL